MILRSFGHFQIGFVFSTIPCISYLVFRISCFGFPAEGGRLASFFQITPTAPGGRALLDRLVLGGAGVGLAVPAQLAGKPVPSAVEGMPTRRAGETPVTRGGAGLFGLAQGMILNSMLSPFSIHNSKFYIH
jgi:hypothetical protein